MSDLKAVWPTLDGFGLACGCGAHLIVTVVFEDKHGHALKDAPPGTIATVAAQEVAVTCEDCQAAHWITVSPDGDVTEAAR